MITLTRPKQSSWLGLTSKLKKEGLKRPTLEAVAVSAGINKITVKP